MLRAGRNVLPLKMFAFFYSWIHYDKRKYTLNILIRQQISTVLKFTKQIHFRCVVILLFLTLGMRTYI